MNRSDLVDQLGQEVFVTFGCGELCALLFDAREFLLAVIHQLGDRKESGVFIYFGDDVAGEVEHSLEVSGGDVEDDAHP